MLVRKKVKTTSESRRGPISCQREKERKTLKGKKKRVPFTLCEPQTRQRPAATQRKGKEKKTKRPIQDGSSEKNEKQEDNRAWWQTSNPFSQS